MEVNIETMVEEIAQDVKKGVDLHKIIKTWREKLLLQPVEKPKCLFPACIRSSHVRGLCNNHYMRTSMLVRETASLPANQQVTWDRLIKEGRCLEIKPRSKGPDAFTRWISGEKVAQVAKKPASKTAEKKSLAEPTRGNKILQRGRQGRKAKKR